MKSLWSLALGVVIVGACAGGASAATIVEVRFASGDPNHVVVTANTDYTIDLWVKIIGTNPNAADGLLNLFAAVHSVQTSLGTVAGGTGVGVTTFSLNSYWKGGPTAPLNAILWREGTGLNYNTARDPNDGIRDWGRYDATPSGNSTIYAVGLGVSVPTYVTTINNPDYARYVTGGAEFKIGTLNFHVGSLVASPAAGASTALSAADIYAKAATGLPFNGSNWSAAIKPAVTYPDAAGNPDEFGSYEPGNAVWFLQATDSQLTIVGGDTVNTTTGASTKNVNLGKVLKNSLARSTQELSKTGENSTSYSVATSGSATTGFTGGAIATGNQTVTGWVGLPTTTYGSSTTGTVTISNTSYGAGEGHGQDDVADVFTVTASVGIGRAARSGLDDRNSFVPGDVLSGGVAALGSYANLASKVIADANVLGTEAILLAGSNPNSAQQTVTMNWRDRATIERCDRVPAVQTYLISDVVALDGMAKDGGNTSGSRVETGMFVISLSYDPSALVYNNVETLLAAQGLIRLAYLNEDYDSTPGPSAGDMWQLAVAGNFGGTELFKNGAYTPADFVLGKYGVDTSTHTVWAVVNHNSQYSVMVTQYVPEPGTICLLIAGGVGMILRRRRARRA